MSDTTPRDLERAVHRVGRYEVLQELGHGGMAVVYLARQLDLDRFVALKELHAFMASDETCVRRFLREAHLSASLTHPNIVTVYDAFDWEGLPYLAMEYLPCGSLRPLISRLTFAQIAGVMEALLAGLARAESAGIVHRDLKPENLLIASDGRLKIADFGIAKAVNASASFLTATGTTIGTPAYMSPEQAMARELGPWTDLYAAGVIAYELVCGHVPFDGGNEPLAVLLQHVSDPVPPPVIVAPGVPDAVVPWILRLLEKQPSDRFQTATEAWDAFEDIVLDVLGPRWRRGARLPAGGASDADHPLTPAAFTRAPDLGEYESYTLPKPSRPPTRTSESALPPFPPAAVAPEPEPIPEPEAPEPVPEPSLVTVAPSAPEPLLATTLAPTSPPPEQPVVVRRHRRPWPAIAAGLIALAIAVAVAVLLATGRDASTKPPPPAVMGTASNGTLSLRFASPPWSEATPGPGIPDLALDDPIALSAGPRGRLYAGQTSATGASLLPASFVGALTGVLPAPARVRLGSIPALGYRDLKVSGSAGWVTVFVAPTDSGVLTLAFQYPARSATAAAALARIATQLKLVHGSAYALAPRRDYAAALNAALRKPLADVRRGIDALKRARTRQAQGSAAAATSRALGRARSGAAYPHAQVSPRDAAAQAALVRAFARTTAAYSALAAAAKADRRPGYEAARGEAGRGVAAIHAAMTEFAKLGYRVPGSRAASAAGAPALLRVPAIPAPPALRSRAHRAEPAGGAAPTPTATSTPQAQQAPAHPAPTSTPSRPSSGGGGAGGGGGGGGEG